MKSEENGLDYTFQEPVPSFLYYTLAGLHIITVSYFSSACRLEI